MNNIEEYDCVYDALEYDFTLIESPEQDVVINNPGIPFFHKFKYPLGLRSDLVIKGAVLDNANRFAIDLCQNGANGKDIIFHFSPRLNLNCVARNSFVKGCWGNEEAHSISKSPFKRGGKFVIEMFLTTHSFLVSVNRKHFCGFTHRLPSFYIDSIEIYGGIKLDVVELSTKESYPSLLTKNNEIILRQLTGKPAKKLMLLPLYYELKGCLEVGSEIQIEGRIKLLPHCMFINLQSGQQIYPDPIVAFHASFRWNPNERDTIVFNSWNGEWNQEVVTNMNLALLPGQDFIITILINQTGFNVKIGEMLLPHFQHRISLQNMNTVFIQGDGEIYSINTINTNFK